jgi:transcriptional regulator NrdR family protein
MTCPICNDEKTLVVGWSTHPTQRNLKVKWEREPCPACQLGPHSGYAQRKAASIAALKGASHE